MNALRNGVLIFAFALAVAASFAQESNSLPTKITVDGVTYEDVRWDRLTPSTVTIYHKMGIATIPLEKLPSELQKRFGYDPKKAADYRAAEAQAAAEARAREAERKAAADRARQETAAQLRSAVKIVIPESTWSSIFLQITDEQKRRQGEEAYLVTVVINHATGRLNNIQKKLERGDGAGAAQDALIGVLLGWYGLELMGDTPESLAARSGAIELRKVLVRIGLDSSTLEPSFVNMNKALRTLGLPTLSRLN